VFLIRLVATGTLKDAFHGKRDFKDQSESDIYLNLWEAKRSY